jgi:NTE family protein
MTSTKKHKIGLVIGSGGIKALGIIPLFELLNDHQLKPDLLIGCSGGCVLSSQWASGSTIEELKLFVQEYTKLIENENLFRKIDFQTLFKINNYPGAYSHEPSAILNKKWIMDFLEKKIGDKKIENNKIKTLILSTDLKTGDPVYLNEGSLAEAIYASCALYPVLPPIHIKKKWLVDGAYHSAIPILEASKLHCDKIISISFEEKPLEKHPSFFEFYMDFISQAFIQNARKQNSFAIHFHHEEILFINCYFEKNINFWDIHNLDYINEVTKATIEKHKENILEYFSSASKPS